MLLLAIHWVAGAPQHQGARHHEPGPAASKKSADAPRWSRLTNEKLRSRLVLATMIRAADCWCRVSISDLRFLVPEDARDWPPRLDIRELLTVYVSPGYAISNW
jgi:hypothetical protein